MEKMTKEEFLKKLMTRRDAERYLSLTNVAMQYHLRNRNIIPVKESGEGRGKVQLFWKDDLDEFLSRNNESKFKSLNETNSTIFEWKGKELRTIKDPYPDGDFYKAIAVDEDDNEYEVKWQIIDPEITDESSICDWYNPISVDKL